MGTLCFCAAPRRRRWAGSVTLKIHNTEARYPDVIRFCANSALAFSLFANGPSTVPPDAAVSLLGGGGGPKRS